MAHMYEATGFEHKQVRDEYRQIIIDIEDATNQFADMPNVAVNQKMQDAVAHLLRVCIRTQRIMLDELDRQDIMMETPVIKDFDDDYESVFGA